MSDGVDTIETVIKLEKKDEVKLFRLGTDRFATLVWNYSTLINNAIVERVMFINELINGQPWDSDGLSVLNLYNPSVRICGGLAQWLAR